MSTAAARAATRSLVLASGVLLWSGPAAALGGGSLGSAPPLPGGSGGIALAGAESSVLVQSLFTSFGGAPLAPGSAPLTAPVRPDATLVSPEIAALSWNALFGMLALSSIPPLATGAPAVFTPGYEPAVACSFAHPQFCANAAFLNLVAGGNERFGRRDFDDAPAAVPEPGAAAAFLAGLGVVAARLAAARGRAAA